MRTLAGIISAAALAGTILPPCLFFAGRMEHETMNAWMVAAAAVWFLATPFWMERKAADRKENNR